MKEYDYDKVYDEVCNDKSLCICENCTDYAVCDFMSLGYTCQNFDWDDYLLHRYIEEALSYR